jgi:uncharacterized metal-binding protein YceD (DUF177 family)
MNYQREFEIGWFGLALGVHEFEYQIDKAKLKRLEYPKIEGLDDYSFNVKMNFDKKSSFFQLKFVIEGVANTICDRCGDPLNIEIWDEFDLIVKLTNEENLAQLEDEDEGDVVFISRNETVINVLEWIYEFIQLSIPIQKIHKNDEEGKSFCNPKALEVLANMAQFEEVLRLKSESPTQDPKDIWKDLGKFKF